MALRPRRDLRKYPQLARPIINLYFASPLRSARRESRTRRRTNKEFSAALSIHDGIRKGTDPVSSGICWRFITNGRIVINVSYLSMIGR